MVCGRMKIYFKSGQVWNGKILEETNAYYRVHFKNGPPEGVIVFKRMVSKIE